MSEIKNLRMMNGGVPVVSAPPVLGADTADQFRAVLLDTVARGHATVVVDMTRTRLCDSYGLHTLLRAHQLAQAAGGEMRLVTPADGLVPRIVALTFLDRLIPCFASLKEALAQRPADANQRRDAPPGPVQASGLPGAWSGDIALDLASAARRLAGIFGGPAVLGSMLGIAASHLVMDVGDGLFGLRQPRGHLSQARASLPGALDLLVRAAQPGRRILGVQSEPGARIGPPRCRCVLPRRLYLAVSLFPDFA